VAARRRTRLRALTRPQRWIAVAIIAGMWLVASEGLLVLLGIAAAATAGFAHAADEPDHTALAQYAFLVAVLALMTRIAVPGTGPERGWDPSYVCDSARIRRPA